DQPRLQAVAFGVYEAGLMMAMDHVAVGQHEAVRRDDDAGTDAARAPTNAGRLDAHNGRANPIDQGRDAARYRVKRRDSLVGLVVVWSLIVRKVRIAAKNLGHRNLYGIGWLFFKPTPTLPVQGRPLGNPLRSAPTADKY